MEPSTTGRWAKRSSSRKSLIIKHGYFSAAQSIARVFYFDVTTRSVIEAGVGTYLTEPSRSRDVVASEPGTV
jgi:hypothetical protein